MIINDKTMVDHIVWLWSWRRGIGLSKRSRLASDAGVSRGVFTSPVPRNRHLLTRNEHFFPPLSQSFCSYQSLVGWHWPQLTAWGFPRKSSRNDVNRIYWTRNLYSEQLNLRTGPTGHGTLFNQWEGALVLIKTSTQWSNFFDNGGRRRTDFNISLQYSCRFHTIGKKTLDVRE